MVFQLRIRSRKGVTRLLFESDQKTWNDFQLEVKDVLSVQIPHQLISKTPLHAPQYINAQKTDTLAKLGFKNGDILYLGGEPRPDDAKEEKKEFYRLTPNCKHTEKGRCIFCDGAAPGEKPVGKCTHGPGATCIHCSKHVQDVKAEPAVWLCNHPETAFCPKCAPPTDPVDKLGPKKKTCSCDHAKGQRCVRCLDLGPAIKIDIMPFKRYMDEKKGMCKYKHPASVTCAFCAAPALPSYVGKQNCNKGHRPWPHGVCLSCAPLVPHIRSQNYRHCDTISIPTRLIQGFYANYFRGGTEKQRAALFFGSYMDEPEETKNVGAIRAIVQAVYEPPQDSKVELRFLRDPNEVIVHEVANWMGVEPVGWVVGTLPRSGEKYGGQVFMSGNELRTAARFQNRYKNKDTGFSRFMTVVLEHSKNIEPKAYQVSDQCVALERDGIFAKAKDPYMLAAREAKQGELVPHVVYKDQELKPGEEFLPDECIVKAIVTTQEEKSMYLFYHNEFPADGNDFAFRNHVRTFSQEQYHKKLSDFNLLVYLHKTIGSVLTKQVCEGLLTKEPFNTELVSALDRSLLEKNLF
jgi:hypothetical protein